MINLSEVNLHDFVARYFYGTKAWIASRLFSTPFSESIPYGAAYRDLARFHALAEIGCMVEFLDLRTAPEDLKHQWSVQLQNRKMVYMIRRWGMRLGFVLAERLQILKDPYLTKGTLGDWPFEKWGDPIARNTHPELALILKLAQYQHYRQVFERHDSASVLRSSSLSFPDSFLQKRDPQGSSRFFSFLEINSFIQARDAGILIEVLKGETIDLLERANNPLLLATAVAKGPIRLSRALGALPKVFSLFREMDALLQSCADNPPLQAAFWSYNAHLFRELESGMNSLILALQKWPIAAETDAQDSNSVREELADTK
jgi:hypothetical protein